MTKLKPNSDSPAKDKIEVPTTDNNKNVAESSTKIVVEEKGRQLRKKRSAIGSMEDLWDENVFEEPSSSPSTSHFLEPAPPPPLAKVKEGSETGSKRSTPVLKISFGTLGQGTVLKIPSKLNGPVVQVTGLNQNEKAGRSVGYPYLSLIQWGSE